jgi:hypothetical protein
MAVRGVTFTIIIISSFNNNNNNNNNHNKCSASQYIPLQSLLLSRYPSRSLSVYEGRRTRALARDGPARLAKGSAQHFD